MELKFSGKVVIITGSGSGIGAVVAEEFAKAGAQVVITDCNVENLPKVAKLCLKASPEGLTPLEMIGDLLNEEDNKRLIDTTIKQFGRLDVLVNNAGKGSLTSVEDPKILDAFDDVMNLNVRSVIQLTHLSVKHLEKTKGNIINTSSMAGLKPMPNLGIYSMSKCALDMFTKCCAIELGPKGIRVNTVNPGLVSTTIGQLIGLDAWKALVDDYERTCPLGRVGQPIDIANAILFLASDQSSWITGINFVVDGAYYGI